MIWVYIGTMPVDCIKVNIECLKHVRKKIVCFNQRQIINRTCFCGFVVELSVYFRIIDILFTHRLNRSFTHRFKAKASNWVFVLCSFQYIAFTLMQQYWLPINRSDCNYPIPKIDMYICICIHYICILVSSVIS